MGAITRGGPWLWAALTVHDVALDGGEPLVPGGVAWSSPRVVLRVDLFKPWRITITPEGLQSLRLPDGSSVLLIADGLTVGLEGDGGGGAGLDVVADAIRLERQGGEGPEVVSAGALSLRLDLAGAATATATDKAVGFELRAQAIHLPDGFRWALGNVIDLVAVNGALSGPALPAAAPREAATAWRDAGGSLEIQLQSLVWGPLTSNGTATLALDDALQPMGAGMWHLVGYQGTFDALGGNGVLTASAVKAAKALLSLMAGLPSAREAPSVDVPLTLQLRTLSMRQIPLLLLPELEWPGQ
jgi:hypothetical protein